MSRLEVISILKSKISQKRVNFQENPFPLFRGIDLSDIITTLNASLLIELGFAHR